MATMDAPGFLEMVLAKGAKAASTRRETRERSSNAMQAIVRLVLHLAGFACLTYAGFAFSLIAGLIVAGISCFVLSTLTTTSTNANADPQTRR